MLGRTLGSLRQLGGPLATLLVCCLGAGLSAGQTSAPVVDPNRAAQPQDADANVPLDHEDEYLLPPTADERGPGRRPFGFAPGMRRMQRLAQGLFRSGPEDEGPLRPGEADELLAFAGEHTPRISRALEALRRRDPELCARKIAEHAPRLRHLRRICERSPRLGAAVQSYADNLFETERVRRTLRTVAADSAEYENSVQTLRDLVAGGVRLEADALEALAADLDDRRAERVEERLAQLTAEGVDLSPMPPRLRDLLARYRDAQTDAEREALRTRLASIAELQITAEDRMLRERAAQLRVRAPELVDERVERFMNGGGPRHGPSDGRGRR